jgi:glycosyltransferase involved in cell wall biosynthesis
MDRCEALARHVACAVHGIEIASRSDEYAWQSTGAGRSFHKHTLFPARRFEDTSRLGRCRRIVQACRQLRVRAVFLTNNDRLDILLVALALRILWVRVYLLSVSKFDDKPRRAWQELLKSLVLLPYRGALAAGPRAESYLRFLGFRRRPVVTGFNTVALDRLVELAGIAPAPDGPAFTARPFVLIGRFVVKKDIGTALAAYARYRTLSGAGVREFHICGAGPLEGAIRGQIADLRLDGVVLHGFLQRDGIARVLAGGLALLLPSIEEQWGLVVNEALAFGLPILASDRVGARDLLVRTAVNGYVFEPGNVEGLARLMLRLAEDEPEWRRLVAGSREFRQQADAARFAEALAALLEATA